MMAAAAVHTVTNCFEKKREGEVREKTSEDTDQTKLLLKVLKEEHFSTGRICSLQTDTNTATESKTDWIKRTQLDSQADG